jgi:geranylgeranyl pyrophosphate synthase
VDSRSQDWRIDSRVDSSRREVARGEPTDLGRITRYGERLGLAFRITDDILDALGQTAAGEGAESVRNERKKATYPSVIGIPQAKETPKELLQVSLDELATYGAQAIALKAIARHIVARAIHGDGKTVGEEIND